MCWKSRDVHIGKDSLRDLFLRKSDDNIYNIFFDMDFEMLRVSKFEYVEIEFHLREEKGFVYFTRYMEYKKGRTIFSCVKEMVKYLLDWKVDGCGHFSVSL